MAPVVRKPLGRPRTERPWRAGSLGRRDSHIQRMGVREDEVTYLRELAKIARRDGRRTKKTVAREYLLKLAERLEKEADKLEEQRPRGQLG